MSSILEQLYYGELRPQKTAWKTFADPADYDNYFTYWEDRFGTLLQEQAPQLKPKFDVLMDDLTQSYMKQTKAMFYHGFSLAIKLVTEALSNT